MANGQVIRAAQMFIKQGTGASKGVNLKAEMAMGLGLGMAVGLTWKVSYIFLTLHVTMLHAKFTLELYVQTGMTPSACRYITGMRKGNKRSTTRLLQDWKNKRSEGDSIDAGSCWSTQRSGLGTFSNPILQSKLVVLLQTASGLVTSDVYVCGRLLVFQYALRVVPCSSSSKYICATQSG